MGKSTWIQLKDRFLRLILTSLSKKFVAVSISGWMTFYLIDTSKFGPDWTGPTLAFACWLTFVGHVVNVDLDTKKVFQDVIVHSGGLK